MAVSGCVVLVHDFREVLEEIAAILENVGLQVVVCHDPLAAITLVRRHRPDTLVTRVDFRCTKFSGETLAQIAKGCRANVVVVYLAQEPYEAFRPKNGEVLQLPVEPAILIRAIELGRYEATSAEGRLRAIVGGAARRDVMGR